MKVLQISTVCGSGSVGRITVDIYHTLKSCGDEGLIAYGRRQAPEGVEAFRFGSDLDMGFHVLSTFFRGEHGFASTGQTRKLIEKIREWDPDVIHLHRQVSQWCGPCTIAGPIRDTVHFMIIQAVTSGRQAVNIVGNIGRPTHMRCSAIIRSRIMCERRLHLPA